MNYVLSNAQMRKADEYTIKTLGYPSETLMRRAGKAIAEEVITSAQKMNARTILVVCGKGNNGGDGYVCAQILLSKNYDVKVYAFSGKLSQDCKREKSRYTGEFTKTINAEIIVDCIFGTGLERKTDGEYAEVIQKINQSGSFIISADVPSGLNGDNGKICGSAVKADLTVAIAEYKLGHFLNDGKDYCGKLVKKDIGISLPDTFYTVLYEESEVKKFLPERKQNSHKGSYGTANIIAGSKRYPGAAVLAVSTALKSGCGYVNLTCQDFIKNSLFPLYPQVIYSQSPDYSADCIAVGMGCEPTQELYGLIKEILNNYNGKLIIDAAGLNAIAKYGTEVLKQKNCSVIITPHVKEFSRLAALSVEEILHSPQACAQSFAKEYGVTVLLKSSSSIICDCERAAVIFRGSSALAKAGSGDMLSGLICGIAAQGKNLYLSAVTASYLIGLSCEISEEEHTAYATTSTEIIKNLSKAFLRLTN